MSQKFYTILEHTRLLGVNNITEKVSGGVLVV